jgi:hypothetical protein
MVIVGGGITQRPGCCREPVAKAATSQALPLGPEEIAFSGGAPLINLEWTRKRGSYHARGPIRVLPKQKA